MGGREEGGAVGGEEAGVEGVEGGGYGCGGHGGWGVVVGGWREEARLLTLLGVGAVEQERESVCGSGYGSSVCVIDFGRRLWSDMEQGV